MKPFFSPKPLWKDHTPTHVWLAKDTNAPAERIPLSQAEKILGIHWTESILAFPFTSKKILKASENTLSSFPLIYEDCIIRWLGDVLGWCLTLRPGKTLPKGFLACYTGLFATHSLTNASSYSQREYFLSLGKTKKKEWIIDAKHNGNMARFLPFLLEESFLENFNIDSEKIAVANLEFQLANLHNFRVPCVYAPRPITAPSDRELLLGLTYSLPYLCKMISLFKFIDKETFTPLDASPKMITIQLEGFSYSFSLPRLRIVAIKELPSLEHTMLGLDEEKNQCYQIIVHDDDIYEAFIKSPETKTLVVKPLIIRKES